MYVYSLEEVFSFDWKQGNFINYENCKYKRDDEFQIKYK